MHQLHSKKAFSFLRNHLHDIALAYYIHLSNAISLSAFRLNVDKCLGELLGENLDSFNPSGSKVITNSAIASIGYRLQENHGRDVELAFLETLLDLTPNSPWLWEAILVTRLRVDDSKKIGDFTKNSIIAQSKDIHESILKRYKAIRSKHKKMRNHLQSLSQKAKSTKTKSGNNNKIKVLYFLHNSLPESSGGYATRAQGVAKGLQDNSIDITCITRPGAPWDISDFKSDSDVKIENAVDNVRYIKIADPSRKEFAGMEYINRSIPAIRQKILDFNPDCIMAASNYLTAYPAMMASKECNIPFIYEVRGFWEITRISRDPEFYYTLNMYDLEWSETFTAQNSDHVFTLTTPMKYELTRRGIDPKKITLAPNSCNNNEFNPDLQKNQRLAAMYNISSETTVIGYIGSFVQYEGLEDLVLACAILKNKNLDFRLLLVGNENVSSPGSKGPITKEIERIAEQHEMTDYIIMPGRIPHGEVADHYSLIDVAPFPRKPQPVSEMVSPMKPLEAFAMKKAVLVSSVKALKEMVKHRQTGIVFKKGDIKDLAAKLEELVLDKNLRRTLGQHAYEWVLQERLWKITANSMCKTIKDTVTTR